ncbi:MULTISPECIES: hypothetical protein [Pseudomonas]|uniref:hypothetical protein n=1 Tax=Pseudomonas TaxID=286 RepID=UPI00042EFFE3|nr:MULTISPECIES: hypothetical protein [Pseudomonas]AHL36738.1 hypothetical protein CD58_29420 [Pseudomonas brassicacearum]SEO63221.1 hypothetical protein SAMN03159293_03381 [Pseudomonas sp. NFACC39-1]
MARVSRRKYEEWRAYANAARTASNELLALLAQESADPERAGEVDFALVRFGDIDARALEQFDLWESDHGFPWHDSPGVIKSDARHLDLALWYGDLLCGLCFATPSGKRAVVRIKLLEGHPKREDGPHPLKRRVIELCVLAVTQYCKIIGAELIEIDSPLPGAVPVYVENEFQMVNGALVLTLDE